MPVFTWKVGERCYWITAPTAPEAMPLAMSVLDETSADEEAVELASDQDGLIFLRSTVGDLRAGRATIPCSGPW